MCRYNIDEDNISREDYANCIYLNDAFSNSTEFDNEGSPSSFVLGLEESNTDNEIELSLDISDKITIETIIHYLSEIYKNLEGLLSNSNETLFELTPYPQLFSKLREDELIGQFKNTLNALSNCIIDTELTNVPKLFECQNSKPLIYDSYSLEERLDKSDVCIPSLLYQDSLPNCGVILMKWPRSIEHLWEEYYKIPAEWSNEHLNDYIVNLRKMGYSPHLREKILNRNISIAELETKYGSSWRNKDKNFSRQINRRKKIWNLIEIGLKDGLTLDECIWVLEKYSHDTHKSLSSYYKGFQFTLSELKNYMNLEGT